MRIANKFQVALAVGGLLLAVAEPPPSFGAERLINLARAQGATPFGNCSDGPFTIGKINDGRFDTLGMWCTGGQPGSFGGVKLGAAPVNAGSEFGPVPNATAPPLRLHRTRGNMPDVPGIFHDGTVGGEFATASHIENRFVVPGCGVLLKGVHPVLGGAVIRQVRQ